jgi:sodium-dependent dicarboxylate transporter 2/3/5
LGIAYGASVGGIGTIIGTPPNLVFQRIYKITFPNTPGISFSEWMVFALPISFIMLFAVWAVLVKLVYPPDKEVLISKDLIKKERESLGKISSNEQTVAIIFALTALLWIFRKDISTEWFTIPGWSRLLPSPKLIDDGTVAITMSFILFVLPSKNKDSNKKRILETGDIRKIPWEIILLFGGGFALAEAFMKTGLSKYLASNLEMLKTVPIMLLIGIISITVVLLTELTSNTATAQIVLPILAAIAIELHIDPKLLMVPATISASLAFMMPVATPPNAIVFGSGRLRVTDMVKAGIILIFVGAIVVTIMGYLFFK